MSSLPVEPSRPWFRFAELLRDAFFAWRRDNPALIAAGLSFFTLFSLPPLVLIGFVASVRLFRFLPDSQSFVDRLSRVLSPEVAESIGTLFTTQIRGSSTVTFLSSLILIWGASSIFSQLQRAFDTIWDASPFPKGQRIQHIQRIRLLALSRLRALVMVIAFGAVLLFFFATDIVVTAAGDVLLEFFPRSFVETTLPVSVHVASLALFAISFAVLFKWLPNAPIRWKDAWVGAFLSSVLFTVGRYVITLYFRYTHLLSFFGAAGSVVVLLLWVYFSMQILLFGAEFTWVFAHRGDDPARERHAAARELH